MPVALTRLLLNLTIFLSFSSEGVTFARVVDLGAVFRPVIELGKPNSKASVENQTQASHLAVETANNLKAGQVVVFSDGHRFELGRFLGGGSSARVWALAAHPEIAIRIPCGQAIQFDLMQKYLEGWKELKRLKVPVIEILDPNNQSLEYQLVERVNIKFTFDQWLTAYETQSSRPRISKPDVNAGLKALKSFSVSSHLLAELTDGLQIGFDGKRWLLFDFLSKNRVYTDARSSVSQTIWDTETLTPDLQATLIDLVLSRRAENPQPMAPVCSSVHLPHF